MSVVTVTVTVATVVTVVTVVTVETEVTVLDVENYLQGYYVKQRSRSNHYSVDLVGPLKQSQIRPNVTFEKGPYPI